MKFIFLLLIVPISFVNSFGQNSEPVKLTANGVELHYIEKGAGEPLVLLHGGIGDYRSWEFQFEEFSKNYRVISYSRRFHYPNKNGLDAKYKTAITEAEDLAAFLDKLEIRRAHLVGLSYGALTALTFAVKHPKRVRSLVLAEPPAHQLIRDLPGGESVYKDFISALKPVAAAFRQGADREAMSLFNGILGRKMDALPPATIEAMMQNAPAIKALSFSADPFPEISKKKLRKLKTPALIVTGENTVEIHKLVDRELARLLPNAKEFVVPDAKHGIPRENPKVFNETVLKFLANVSGKKDAGN